MKKQIRFLVCVLLLVPLAMIIGFGCGSDNGPTGSTSINVDSLIQLANDSLGRQLNFMINTTLDNPDTSFRPSDLDFTGLNDLYSQALVIDPSNLDAEFGVAFTNLMIFLDDPTLNDLVDRFKYVTDTSSLGMPLRTPEIILGGEFMPNRIPLSVGRFNSIFPDLTRLDHSLQMSASGNPLVSEIQNLLETNFLPRIDAAISHLTDVIASPTYVFVITPAMQGNLGANPIEVDRSDFRVFLAVAHGAKAAIHVFLARNLDPISYDIAGANAAMQPGSLFLDLRPGGHMPLAKTSLLAGVSAARAALMELKAEANAGWDQANELIKVYPGDAADLQQAIDSIDYYVTYFDGPKQLDIIWTRRSYWDCDPNPPYNCQWVVIKDTISATVDISKFFDAPMDNPKNFIPAYTFSLTELPSNFAEAFADAHFSRTRLDSAFISIYGVGTGDATLVDSINKYSWYMGYSQLPNTNTAEFYSKLATYNAAYNLGWDDFTFNTWCSPGDKNLGCYWSNQQEWYRRFYGADQYAELCVGWQSGTYAGLTFPHPTFNGLLPGTTSDDIKSWINETPPVSWDQSLCDTISF